jgi:hypothetical protein
MPQGANRAGDLYPQPVQPGYAGNAGNSEARYIFTQLLTSRPEHLLVLTSGGRRVDLNHNLKEAVMEIPKNPVCLGGKKFGSIDELNGSW